MNHLFAFTLLVLSALHSAGQTFNNRYNFGPDTGGNGYSVEQKGDSLLLFSEYADSLYKIGIHILDLNGAVLDTRSIDNDNNWLHIGYANASDKFEDGFVSAGSIRYPLSGRKGYMVKWNNQLDTTATQLFETLSEESSLFLYQAKKVDYGFVAVGTKTNSSEMDKIILIRTDNNLNEIWRTEYGSSSVAHEGYSVVKTPDGGFLIGGVRKIPNSWDQVIIKTDELGVQQDIAYFGLGYEGYIAHVEVTADGEYVFGGMKKTGDDEYQSMVCKLDDSLNEEWCNTFHSPGPQCYVNAIKHLNDGSLIVCGFDRVNGEIVGYIAKVDTDGNTLWYRRYSQTEGNSGYFFDVIQTTDGGFFLTGYLYAYPELTRDTWGIKLDDMGCLVPGCDTVQAVLSMDGAVAFSIFPNPTSQFINVHLSSLNPVNNVVFELSDLQGRRVKSFSPQLSDTTYMMDVQELPSGMYLIKMLRNGELVKSEKIIIE